MDYTPGQLRKAGVAALSFVLVALNLAANTVGLIPDPAMKWVSFVLALGTIYGVFKAPNDPATAPAAEAPHATGFDEPPAPSAGTDWIP